MGRRRYVVVTYDPFATLVTHTKTHTHTQLVAGVKSELGTGSRCGYLNCHTLGAAHSGCYFPLPIPSILPTFHSQQAVPCQWGHHLTQRSHNAVLSAIC